jgi:DNA polymerase
MTGDPAYVEMLFGDPIAAVATGLRHALVPERGCLFHTGDYSQIEARQVLALAGQYDKCDVFAKRGSGIYLDMAEIIYGRSGLDKKKDVTEYTRGKNTILGCGFQMGKKTFRERYCPDQSEEFAEKAIRSYRYDFAPEVPKLWQGLEDAALKVMQGAEHAEAYGVTYRRSDKWMCADLPSGQTLWYYNPRYNENTPMPWSTPEKPDYRPAWSYYALKNGQWIPVKAYGGLLTENVVQALARGILVEAMFRLEREGFPLVLTVHDENVAERANGDQKAFEQIMAEPPRWAQAMRVPIAVEGWCGERYRK